MDRINVAGGSPTGTLSNGAAGFLDQNLSAGQQGTNVPAAFMNAVQETLIDPITAAGLTPSLTDFTQLTQAIRLLGGAVEASIGASGFIQLAAPGGEAFVLNWGAVSLNASTASQSIAVTQPFPTAFLGGLVTDAGAGAYAWALTNGADRSHVILYCPLNQNTGSGIGPRLDANGHFFAWGH